MSLYIVVSIQTLSPMVFLEDTINQRVFDRVFDRVRREHNQIHELSRKWCKIVHDVYTLVFSDVYRPSIGTPIYLVLVLELCLV